MRACLDSTIGLALALTSPYIQLGMKLSIQEIRASSKVRSVGLPGTRRKAWKTLRTVITIIGLYYCDTHPVETKSERGKMQGSGHGVMQ